ncbi:ankyrin repeat-containing protein P16F5.05c isoform X3 [Selaginella moellendorffii]|uniref:ankyrin repeat-containing protein P16F5.05c isoform X3 n=1 Tax=Selaginella moellendorffii TaxID=88036 RepID=UPI000D1C2CA3|nr:ankyrin repeat-containing protein P16F5.05c isoform X3 [Selaginella moellendorffii]|eukprot:XP_024516251.1 ankyrin repeat-containing protein P16F5.05c isoform X3 [Selaginella moellendorffii]
MGRVLPASEEPPPAQECEFDVDDLLQAARYGELEEVKLVAPLLPQNSHNEQGCTALHMASANGHLSIVKYLIERGENVNACNAENNTPLHWAPLNGQFRHVFLLATKCSSFQFLFFFPGCGGVYCFRN